MSQRSEDSDKINQANKYYPMYIKVLQVVVRWLAIVVVICHVQNNSLSAQSVGNLLDVDGKAIALRDDHDIIQHSDGNTYFLFSSIDNEIEISGEVYTGIELPDTVEDYEEGNEDFHWIVKMLPDFTVERVISVAGSCLADITIGGGQLFMGLSFHLQTISVNGDLVVLNEDTDGTVLRFDLDLNYDTILVQNDLRFHSFDASEENLVMQFLFHPSRTRNYAYFGLDTVYTVSDWNLQTPLLVVYNIENDQIVSNWAYGTDGNDSNSAILMSEDDNIYTTFNAGGGHINISEEIVDTVIWNAPTVIKYTLEGNPIWYTQNVPFGNFHYSYYHESDNELYLEVFPNALEFSVVGVDTIWHLEGSRPSSIAKLDADGNYEWLYTPLLFGGTADLISLNVEGDIVSGTYRFSSEPLDNVLFLDSTYTDLDRSTLFFNLDRHTGKEISSFLLKPTGGSAPKLAVKYLSHDSMNDKVYLGIELPQTEAQLFGVELGEATGTRVYFLEIDMNFLVSTEDQSYDSSLFSCYPNPVSRGNSITLVTKSSQHDGHYQLVDANGRLVAQGIKPLGVKSLNIDTPNVNTGVYILKYQEDQKTKSQITIIK